MLITLPSAPEADVLDLEDQPTIVPAARAIAIKALTFLFIILLLFEVSPHVFCNCIITLIQEVLYYNILKNISFMTLFEKIFIKNHAFLIFLIGKPFHIKRRFSYKIRVYGHFSNFIHHSSLIKCHM